MNKITRSRAIKLVGSMLAALSAVRIAPEASEASSPKTLPMGPLAMKPPLYPDPYFVSMPVKQISSHAEELIVPRILLGTADETAGVFGPKSYTIRQGEAVVTPYGEIQMLVRAEDKK